jgi:hypothetical protein
MHCTLISRDPSRSFPSGQNSIREITTLAGLKKVRRYTLGHPTLVVGLRFKNIAAIVLGKVDQWGLSNEDTRDSGIHSNTPNLLPFLLKKDSSVSETITDGLIVALVLAFVMLIVLLWFIQRKARAGELTKA